MQPSADRRGSREPVLRTVSVWRVLLAVGFLAGAQSYSPPLAAATGIESSVDNLLRSARIWRIKGRSELSRAALEKLLTASPDHPEGLLQLGLLELQTKRFDEAKAVRERLRRIHPTHPNSREMNDAYRIASTDRLAMATARRQLQTYATQSEGIAAMRALFPDGPPTGELGIEYWLAVGRQDDNWQRARQALDALVAAKPWDPQYELALARHLLRRDDTLFEGIDRIAALADRVDANPYRVLDAWRDGVLDLPPGPASDVRLADYLERKPDDQAVAQYAARIVGQPAPRPPVQAARASSRPSTTGRSAAAIERAAPSRPPTLRETLEAKWWSRGDRQAVEAAQGFADNNLYRASVAARAYREAGRYAAAAELLDDVLRADAANLTAISERAQLLRDQQGFDAAQSWLLQQRAEQAWQQAEIDRIRAEVLDARAEVALESGDAEQAIEAWQRAVQLDPGNPWTRYALASQLLDTGRRVSARRLMTDGVRAAPSDADTRYAAALVFSRLDDVDMALEQMRAVPDYERSDSMRALEARLRQRKRRVIAAKHVAAGDLRGAVAQMRPEHDAAQGDASAMRELARFWQQQNQQTLAFAVFEPYLYADPMAERAIWLAWIDLLLSEDRDTLAGQTLDALIERDGMLAFGDGEPAARLAGLYQRMNRPLDSTFWWRRAVLGDPDRVEWQAELAQDLAAMGEGHRAREQLATLSAEPAPGQAMDIARVWISLDRPREAVRVSERALARQPDNAALRLEAGQVAESAGAYNRAATHYKLAGMMEPEARADLAALRKRRQQASVQIGLDGERKPGDPGISENSAANVSISMRWPIRMKHHFLAFLDPVRVDAGRIPDNYDDAADYGTFAAIGPDAFAQGNFPSATAQRGLAFGVGVETDWWRLDLGHAPTAFGGADLVGGFAVSGSWRGLSLSGDIGRRPVTSSLVSYAGGRDPVSGRTWGTVRETSIGGRFAYDWGRFDLAVSPRYSWFAGENVPDNTRAALRFAADYLTWQGGWAELFVGLRATYWAYDNNQRFYTFGHGGYFSPQQYLSLVVPALDLRGRFGRTTWQLRGGLSRSFSDEDSEPFFPTDPNLQQAAAAFEDPFYEGGSGGGSGLNLSASVSQHLWRHWEVGGRFAIDRSDFYEPNFFQLYLRREWNPGDRLPSDPPRGVTPYAGL